MAEETGTENYQKVKLQPILSSKGKLGYYAKGKLLSISDISENLDESMLDGSGGAMKKTITNVAPHDFQHMQVSFPITHLQHVTDWDSVRGICNQEGFTVKQRGNRPGFNELLCWSAAVSSDDTETAHQEAYDAVREVIPPADAELYQGEIKEQFANSPAFSTTSRYGNFRFSFPLSDLLSLYKSQHCGDGEPQLRILGTDIYKQEIAHYIVVHGPDTDQFNDLPKVHSMSKPRPFVFWKDETLFWRPESTSVYLKVKISEDGSVFKDCYQSYDQFLTYGRCSHENDKTFSVWNHLVLAFHLPNQHYLKIPKQDLLENLTDCGAGYPYLGKEKVSRAQAKQMINELKTNDNIDY
ncbi:uncharacterized protein LOC142103751 [Mixophyes fleayi]|uniref:uncharacterized protein LOC142103751 n=1 Tax=Mixophyes fleayi TaxID=3061075 RepID=UPI003F4E2524